MVYKDIEQFERLLRVIYRPQNYYCIHVDKKSYYLYYQAVKAITACFQNVFLSSKRIPVNWGHMSVLDADLYCMKDLLRYKNWKYLINLTGQEFPLKTNADIVQILTALNGSNSIKLNPPKRYRLKYFHHNGNRTKELRKDPLPEGIRPYQVGKNALFFKEFRDHLGQNCNWYE